MLAATGWPPFQARLFCASCPGDLAMTKIPGRRDTIRKNEVAEMADAAELEFTSCVGMAFGLVDYLDELSFICAELPPRMERLRASPC